MKSRTVHRLYTEEKNRKAILKLTAAAFESFTVQPTIGYYRGKPEKSMVIELAGVSEKTISALARRVRAMNGQKICPSDAPERQNNSHS
jgi:hypothetical protein